MVRNKANQNTQTKKIDRKTLTLFLIIFPSLLIAGDYGSLLANAAIKGALIFYQFVLLKSFLERYYQLID